MIKVKEQVMQHYPTATDLTRGRLQEYILSHYQKIQQNKIFFNYICHINSFYFSLF